MIKIEKANKYFNRFRKNQVHAIDNTSLKMGSKGLVAILGASGCGKTTLLNAIGGLDRLNSGKIYINGKKINSIFSGQTDKIRNLNIGYIFQKFLLIDDMTVFENVALVLKMVGIKDKKEIKKRVEYVLEKVGMEQYKNRYPTMLSGGQRQRVAIARAIVKNPNIIIADEPTGNLDSKNSLEIMKIIKSISEEKLVVLVTHEKDLASFFSTRIIEVVDGKIVSDRKNEHTEDLDYKLDSKIYLKDIKENKEIKENEVNIKFYNDSNENTNITVVVRNGNIYIKSNDNKKVEVVDENSSIELVDDHYKKMSKEEQEKYKFNFDKVINNNIKLRYTSIYNIFSLVLNGFKKLFRYPLMKKLLLIGFFISAMFVSYAVYNISGITRIKDENFTTQSVNNISVNVNNLKVQDYLDYEQNENIKYIIPSDSNIKLKIPFKEYYQTSDLEYLLSGSLTGIDAINKEKLIHGRMPENENEIVVDKILITDIINKFFSKQVGLGNVEDFLNLTVTLSNMPDMKLVGIVDMKTPCIYMNESKFINVISNSNSVKDPYEKYYSSYDSSIDETLEEEICNYNLYLNKLTLKEGKLPESDYEVIVNIVNKEKMKLNQEIDTTVNGRKLKVVGYYESKYDLNSYFVNENTIKYMLIKNATKLTIYTENKADVIKYFKDKNINAEDVYEVSKTTYKNKVKEKVTSTVVMSAVILVISLIEIYLMMRSSFLSRVKEVGVLRAIGVKKKDVRKMFLGEIIAITLIASIPGYGIMTYVIYNISKISYFSDRYLASAQTMLISLAIIVVVNIIVGLMPLFGILRKTPAEILSRTDVD